MKLAYFWLETIYLRLRRAFYLSCHRDGLEIESVEFQQKPANKFSQKEFDSIKLKTIFLVSLFKQLTWSISFEYIVLILLCFFVSTTQPLSQNCLICISCPPVIIIGKCKQLNWKQSLLRFYSLVQTVGNDKYYCYSS